MAFGKPNSPQRLVWLALAGGLLASIPILPVSTHTPRPSGAWYLGTFLLAVIGILLIGKSRTNLRNGIENQEWPTEQVESLRNFFTSPLTLTALAVLVVAYIAMMLSVPHGLHDFAWSMYGMLFAFSSVAGSFIRVKEPTIADNLRDARPLQSSHWGNR